MKKLLILICTLFFTSVSCLAQLYPIPEDTETTKMLKNKFPSVYYDIHGFYITCNATSGTKEYKKAKRALFDHDGNEIIPLGDYDVIYLSASSSGRGKAYPYFSVDKGKQKAAYSLDGKLLVPFTNLKDRYIYYDLNQGFFTYGKKYKKEYFSHKHYIDINGNVIDTLPKSEIPGIRELIMANHPKTRSLDFMEDFRIYRVNDYTNGFYFMYDFDGTFLVKLPIDDLPTGFHAERYFICVGKDKVKNKEVFTHSVKDIYGNVIIPKGRYKYIAYQGKGNYAGAEFFLINNEDDYGVCDMNGVELIAPYHDIPHYDDEIGFYNVGKKGEKKPFNIFLNPEGSLDNVRTKALALEKPESKSAKFWRTVAQVADITTVALQAFNEGYQAGSSSYRAPTAYTKPVTRTTTKASGGNSSASSGSNKCSQCGGTGKCGNIKVYSAYKMSCHGTGDCKYCNEGFVYTAHGKHICSICKGKDKCSYCNGTGKCSKCNGKGVY